MSLFGPLNWMDRTLTALSPIGAIFFGAGSVYYVAFSYGLSVVTLVSGRDSMANLVASTPSHPMTVILGIPMIPVSLVTLEAMDIDGRLLSFWRSHVSPALPKLPVMGKVIEYLWPTPTREPLNTSELGREGMLDFITRNLTAGLLFPFVSYFLGETLFKSIQSNFKRLILSGIIFFMLKTCVKMYLRQQQYRRQGFRRVLNYPSQNT